MARDEFLDLREIPRTIGNMKVDRLMRLLRDTVEKWWGDNPWRLSAALSYYTLFSLAPLLTIAVAIAAVVVDEDAVQQELFGQFEDLIGKSGAEAMANMLHSAGHPAHGAIATVVSLVTLLVVSMGMFSELQDALNFIWRIPGKRSWILWDALRTRLLSFMLVIGTGFLLLVSLIMSAVSAAVGKFIHRAVPWPQLIMTIIDRAGSPIVISLLFALMFKMLPEGYIAWRDVWIGAIATAMLFTIGKWAIGIYLGGAAMASMYGAASSLMAILVWVYYSALIFFLGAEFTYVYAHEYGSRRAHR
jgi:membrane protein